MRDRTPAQRLYERAGQGEYAVSCDLSDAALARAEEVNESRLAAEKQLRASILDLKDQINALDKAINAVGGVVDEHAAILDDLRPDSKPAIDPVLLGLAMAWRATANETVRSYLVIAYRYYVRDFRQKFSGVARILDTYGLEGS